MIVIVDERQTVTEAFVVMLEREGVAAIGLCPAEFRSWITAIPESDLTAVEAFLVGECGEQARLCGLIAARTRAVTIAMSETRSLERTLELFAAGVDDEVRKPVHVREILARINAVSRRAKPEAESARFGQIRVFFDGRDPEIDGDVFQLPRRERRILEYMAGNVGCRVTKSQIFSAVYGLFNEEIDENVIESHISKLRKRLRARLGYDPIDCRRFLGYRLAHPDEIMIEDRRASSAQDNCGLMARELQFVRD